MQEIVGDGRAIQLRLKENLFLAVERWRGEQLVVPSRSEAIRELIRQSLHKGAAAPRKGADR